MSENSQSDTVSIQTNNQTSTEHKSIMIETADNQNKEQTAENSSSSNKLPNGPNIESQNLSQNTKQIDEDLKSLTNSCYREIMQDDRLDEVINSLQRFEAECGKKFEVIDKFSVLCLNNQTVIAAKMKCGVFCFCFKFRKRVSGRAKVCSK